MSSPSCLGIMSWQPFRQIGGNCAPLVSSLSEVLSCMHLNCQLRAADSADRALLLAQVQFYSFEKYSVSTNSVPGLGIKELTLIGINTHTWEDVI